MDPGPSLETPPSRMPGVEVLRVVAVCAVLVIHLVPFGHVTGVTVVGRRWDAATIANQLARFAVPAFFVLSGYFWARRTAGGMPRWSVTRRTIQRLLLVFAGWSLVFILPWEGERVLPDFPHRWWANVDANLAWIGRHPWQVAFAGTNSHLWFLMALAQATTLGALLDRRGRGILLPALGVVLYAVYLLAKPYRATPLGLSLPFNPRNGPFLALLPFTLGVLLSRRHAGAHWIRWGAWVTAIGVALSALELSWLHATYRTSLAQDAVIGTMAFGTGMAMMALADPHWLATSRLALASPYVLGIYAVHPIFIELLGPLTTRFRSPLWDGVAWVLVLILSLAATRLLARWRRTRWLVR